MSPLPRSPWSDEERRRHDKKYERFPRSGGSPRLRDNVQTEGFLLTYKLGSRVVPDNISFGELRNAIVFVEDGIP